MAGGYSTSSSMGDDGIMGSSSSLRSSFLLSGLSALAVSTSLSLSTDDFFSTLFLLGGFFQPVQPLLVLAMPRASW